MNNSNAFFQIVVIFMTFVYFSAEPIIDSRKERSYDRQTFLRRSFPRTMFKRYRLQNTFRFNYGFPPPKVKWNFIIISTETISVAF